GLPRESEALGRVRMPGHAYAPQNLELGVQGRPPRVRFVPRVPFWQVSGMDTDAILTLLKETAADLITPRFRALSDEEVMEKAPGDLVTVADREAEDAITARLREASPAGRILGTAATKTGPGLTTAI